MDYDISQPVSQGSDGAQDARKLFTKWTTCLIVGVFSSCYTSPHWIMHTANIFA